MSSRQKRLYEFGPYRLDAAEQRLTRAGVSVPLKRKELETLLVLVENCGRLVGKEKFFAEVWPDAEVEDGSLTVSISKLRKALGRDDEGRQYIETVPRLGYRFVAGVRVVGENGGRESSRADGKPGAPTAEEEQAQLTAEGETETTAAEQPSTPSAPQPAAQATQQAQQIQPAQSLTPESALTRESAPKARRRRAAFVVAFALAAVVLAGVVGFVAWRNRGGGGSTQRTLAVLPFDSLKPDPSTDFLRCSLAHAVMSKLGDARSLVIRPPSSACSRYRAQQTPDPLKAAEELGVNTLLAGSYLKEGDHLHVNAQLIDVPTNRVIWQEAFSFRYDRLAEVQERVPRRVIAALALTLTPEEARRFGRDGPADPRAFEHYLRGVDFYYAEDYVQAIRELESSVALDANYPRAWALLGSARSVHGSLNFGGAEFYAKSQEAYERALALDPGLTEAKAFLADLLVDTNRFEEATRLLRGALEADPDDALARWELAYAYRFGGMLEESIAEGERSRAADPTLELASAPFSAYLYAGRYDEFVARMRGADESALLLFYRGLARYYQQDRERAAADFRRSHQLDPTLLASRTGLALLHGIEGRPEEGLKILREVEARVLKSGVIDGEGVYKIAQGYAALGDRAAALRMLGRSIEGGFVCYPYFLSDPLLDNLRAEPGFDQLLDAARRRHEAYKRDFFARAPSP